MSPINSRIISFLLILLSGLLVGRLNPLAASEPAESLRLIRLRQDPLKIRPARISYLPQFLHSLLPKINNFFSFCVTLLRFLFLNSDELLLGFFRRLQIPASSSAIHHSPFSTRPSSNHSNRILRHFVSIPLTSFSTA